MALIVTIAADLPVWAPTADDVARRLPRRYEFQAGSANINIDGHVLDVVADIKASVRADVPVDLMEYARGTAAVGVASRLEAEYFPEQSEDVGTPAARLSSEYTGRLLRLRNLVGSSAGPLFSFPPAPVWPAG
jgi:hypothetical protein